MNWNIDGGSAWVASGVVGLNLAWHGMATLPSTRNFGNS